MKDYFRLAVLPEHVTTRWCVQLMSSRLGRDLAGVARNCGVRLGMNAGDITTLTNEGIAAVAATARGSLASLVGEYVVVSARCVDVLDSGPGLRAADGPRSAGASWFGNRLTVATVPRGLSIAREAPGAATVSRTVAAGTSGGHVVAGHAVAVPHR